MYSQQNNNDEVKDNPSPYANLTSISHLHHEVCKLYNETGSFIGTARKLCERHPELELTPNYCRSLIQVEINSGIVDADIVAENVKLQKKAARQQAFNRIERKAFREAVNIENAVVEILNEIKETLSNFGEEFSNNSIPSNKIQTEEGSCLVLHLTDAHFNSNINIPSNVYNYTIAAQRLFAFVQRAKQMAAVYNVSKIVVALGGDFMKNLARPEELLTVASNRAKGTILVVHLLKQVLLDLSADYPVDVFSVAGNESRISIGKVPDISWDESGATENFDSLIHWSLENLFSSNDRIKFHPHHGNECIFTVNGKTIMLIHGHQLNFSNQSRIQAFTGKMAAEGIFIDLIMSGHHHSTYIGDTWARGSSLCGTDGYASEGLGFSGRAAQNLHIIHSNGIDSIKVDLQSAPKSESYDIMNRMKDLHVEKESKMRPNYHVHLI